MFNIFSNKESLNKIFQEYSVLEALKVKKNVQYTLTNIGLPSEELLVQLQTEGFDINEFDSSAKQMSGPVFSESVVMANMKAIFLSKDKLCGIVKMFNLSEKIAIRDIFREALMSLRLPSEALLQQMINEGLAVDDSDDEQDTDAKIASQLKAAQPTPAPAAQPQQATVQHLRVAPKPAEPQEETKASKLDEIKNKLASALSDDKPEEDTAAPVARKVRMYRGVAIED